MTLWNLLRTLQTVVIGLPRGRRSAINEGVREYRRHADEAVLCWRDHRQIRERILQMAASRGLRGWDDPAQPRYRGSAPIESQRRAALDVVETALFDHAARWVAQWLAQRKVAAEVTTPARLVERRRNIVSLLSEAGLGYERIASLATAKLWNVPPCPLLSRRQLVEVLKSDLRKDRRAAPRRSAAVL